MSKQSMDNFDDQFYGVLHLEDHDFNEDGTLKPLPAPYNNKPVVVMVFATWCGPCKMAKPEYKKLKEMLGDSSVVAAINGSGEDTLPSEQRLMKRSKTIFPDFRGFPHISVFDRNGKVAKTHSGKRSTEDIAETVRQVQ